MTQASDTAPRRALIVGNSDGIGLALTRALLARGWHAAGASRSAGPLAPSTAYAHAVLDVAAADYPARLAELCAGRAPSLCVYCAGVGAPVDLGGDLAAEARTFDVNLTGAVRTAQVVLPAMIAAGAGHLVVLSSLADAMHSPEAPAYAASKAGLSRYFESLALALRPRGVAVTNVRFGFVDTKMARGAVRPFMVAPDDAVRVILRALERRPVRVSYPWRMAALVAVLGLVGRARVALG